MPNIIQMRRTLLRSSAAIAASSSVTLTVGSASANRTGDAGTTQTFTALNFPAAAAGRLCCVHFADYHGGLGAATGITIDGVAATKLVESAGASLSVSIWGRVIAAGTSFDVGVTVGTGNAFRIYHLYPFVAVGASSLTPSDTQTLAYTSADKTLTLTVPTGGVGAAMVANDSTSQSFSWSSGVEDFADISTVPNLQSSVGHASGTGSQVLTAAVGPGLVSGVMCGAAWGP